MYIRRSLMGANLTALDPFTTIDPVTTVAPVTTALTEELTDPFKIMLMILSAIRIILYIFVSIKLYTSICMERLTHSVFRMLFQLEAVVQTIVLTYECMKFFSGDWLQKNGFICNELANAMQYANAVLILAYLWALSVQDDGKSWVTEYLPLKYTSMAGFAMNTGYSMYKAYRHNKNTCFSNDHSTLTWVLLGFGLGVECISLPYIFLLWIVFTINDYNNSNSKDYIYYKRYDSYKILLVGVLTRIPNELAPFGSYDPYEQILVRALPLVYPAVFFYVHKIRSQINSSEAAKQSARLQTPDELFLRAMKDGDDAWRVEMSPENDEAFSLWNIVDHRGMVVIQSYHDKELCLSWTSDNCVGLSNCGGANTKWTPFKNEEGQRLGSWSFKNGKDRWLSTSRTGGIVCTVSHGKIRAESERFFLHIRDDSKNAPENISPMVKGWHSLKTSNGKYVRARKNRSWRVGLSDKRAFWQIIHHKGTVAFKSNSYKLPHYLNCNEDGLIYHKKGAVKCTKWTPLKNEDGTWSFSSESGRWLSSYREDGIISTASHNKKFERFFLCKRGAPVTVAATPLSEEVKGQYSLKAFNGMLVHADKTVVDKTVVRNRGCSTVSTHDYDYATEFWHIIDRGDKVMIQSHLFEGKYINYKSDGTVDYNVEAFEWTPVRHEDGTWSFYCTNDNISSLWMPIKNPDGTWSFCCSTKRWLSAGRTDGIICAVKRSHKAREGNHERFTLCQWGNREKRAADLFDEAGGDCSIKSYNGKFVQTQEVGSSKRVVLAPTRTESGFWHIEDRQGKVAIKSHFEEGLYLSCNFDGTVDYSKCVEDATEWILYSTVLYEWSFMTSRGQFLSAYRSDGIMCTVPYLRKYEGFEICPSDPKDARLSAEMKGAFSLKTSDGMYIRADQDGNWSVDLSPNCVASEFWNVEDHYGTVAIRSNNSELQYLSCNTDGIVACSLQEGEGAQWRPVKNSNGSWSFKTSTDAWLSASHEGVIISAARANGKEEFTLCPWGDQEDVLARFSSEAAGQRVLKSFNGKYMQALPSSDACIVDLVDVHCIPYDCWHVEDNNGVIRIASHRPDKKRQYLSWNWNGTVDYRLLEGDKTKWTPFKNGDGSWSFKNANGQWLSAYGDNSIICTVRQNQKCERFMLESW